ncbi:PREDICTED: C-type lectin 37Da-like [Nicrophorus vespilloides]|uniref:C-type lectin 37Da-like n=1 Tax=Nicrophorus vespilloides TaxID=110193 RepID=A0ABM1M6V5_NICVS|nr:PREDICTED: C-type lectin 37Da-like [Nicrophorus vespilloides]
MAFSKWFFLASFVLVAVQAHTLQRRSPFHFQYKNKLYYIETFYKATFYKAFMSCSKLGMNLVSIESDDEFDKLHEFIKTNTKYEHGMAFWTSAAAMEPLQFHWMLSGYPVGLASKWLPGEPNNKQGNEYCMHLWVHNKKLVMNDESCTTQAFYICEQPKLVTSSDIRR